MTEDKEVVVVEEEVEEIIDEKAPNQGHMQAKTRVRAPDSDLARLLIECGRSTGRLSARP